METAVKEALGIRDLKGIVDECASSDSKPRHCFISVSDSKYVTCPYLGSSKMIPIDKVSYLTHKAVYECKKGYSIT